MEQLTINGSCEIVIGPGLTDLDDILPGRDRRGSSVVLTQPGAAPIARSIARRIQANGVRVLPEGDAAKTLAVAEDTYRWMLEEGVGRHDTMVAVGGGSTTDVGGFVAATYMRGIEAVYVPTTLLGAVDGAIGGKSGLNLGPKNLIGVFRHPARIIIDVDVLAALPPGLRADGLVEALKTGLVADRVLAEMIADNGANAPLDEVVLRSVRAKAAIVERDFTEAGERAVLNYGHTVGHAVEAVTGVSHGTAVSVGMAAAALASSRLIGFTEGALQARALALLGMPQVIAADPEEVNRMLAADKKRREEGLRMVLLQSVGQPVVCAVDEATVAAILSEVIQ